MFARGRCEVAQPLELVTADRGDGLDVVHDAQVALESGFDLRNHGLTS